MDEETITAADFVTRTTLEEVEAAVAHARGCSYRCRTRDTAGWPGAPDVPGIMQTIFSCRTCALVGGGSPVGVCEPCALRCHADHELIEVGVRRTFRCDCPTERCPAPCVSNGARGGSSKDPASTSNRYGQNFEGRFCSCGRQYDAKRDEMVQCVACDEWFHDVHVPGFLPGDLEGMVCASCVSAHPYLRSLARYTPGTCEAKAPGAEHARATDVVPPVPGKPAPQVSESATAGDAQTCPSTSGGGTADLAPSPGGSTAASVPPASMNLQAWVACLTCSDGADEGSGVCMACAERCHAGHVMTKPRITLFVCDCADLLQSKQRGECLCSPPLVPPTPIDERWCAKRACAAPAASSGGAPSTTTPAVADRLAPHEGAPLASPESTADPHRFVDGAAVFLLSDDDLLAALCRCNACMDVYASDGVATWWLTPEDAPLDPTAPLAAGLAEPALQRVPDLIAEVLGGLQRRDGARGGAVGGGAASGASLQATSAGGAFAPGVSAETDAAAGELADAIRDLRQAGFQTSYEAGLAALQQLPPTQQVAALSSYGELAHDLMPFLRTFAEAGRVVTAEDIRAFFANLADGRRVRSRLG